MYFLYDDEIKGLKELGFGVNQSPNAFSLTYDVAFHRVSVGALALNGALAIAGVTKTSEGKQVARVFDVLPCHEREHGLDENTFIRTLSDLLKPVGLGELF